jgi:hypothetical protein
MLQYVSDNTGETTAVLIPIKEWEAIVEKHSDLKNIEKSPTGKKKLKPSDYKGIFSEKDAKEFHKYLTKTRKEWERSIY